MSPGERRRLVFTNLALGRHVPQVMAALKLSEDEVMADYEFVCQKLRSYRFERVAPVPSCASLDIVRANRVELLHLLTKINLDRDPTFTRVNSLPLVHPEGGGISEAERVMFEMRMRAR